MKILLSLFCVTLLAACASEVVRNATVLSVSSDSSAYTLTEKTYFRFDSGYGRGLPEGTRLVVAGAIPEGRVLKPSNTSFTIEGRHMHEAWIVERAGHAVGFYLPVEKAFAPLSNAVPLPLKGETQK